VVPTRLEAREVSGQPEVSQDALDYRRLDQGHEAASGRYARKLGNNALEGIALFGDSSFGVVESRFAKAT
jgi:hypothetical protein